MINVFPVAYPMRRLGTMEIVTERLVLRRFRETDAEEAYENFGKDEEVARYVSFDPWRTLAGTEEFIRLHLDQYDTNPDYYGWAITLDGKVIGNISIFDIDHDSESCELGYYLGRDWWGNGYATEAAKAVINYAFVRLFAHRVFASHHPENVRSKRVLEKAGMKYEGTMRDAQRNRDGTFSDLLLYAVLSND